VDQTQVLKLIAYCFGGSAAVGIAVSVVALLVLRKKTEEKREARLHGHTLSPKH
jgi:hypothetical protein